MRTKLLSFLYVILSALCYSSLVIFVKQLSDYSVFTILFFRFLIPFLILLTFFSLNNKNNFSSMVFDKANMGFLLIRSIIGNFGVFLSFYSMELLSPSDATSLYLTYPMLISIFGIIILHEKITINKIIAYLFSILGVLFVFRPNLRIDHFPFIVGLSAALFLAISYILVGYSNERRKISPLVFLFNLTAVGLLMTVPFVFLYGIKIEYKDIFVFLIMGVLSLLIQLFATMAYKIGKASEISVFNYFSLIFSITFSIIFLGIYPDFYSILGGAFIFLSGVSIYLSKKY